jgi:DNA topoisomerase-1
VAGNRITFDFVAKEGLDAHYEITDARLADWLQKRIDSTKPGEKLFPDVPAGKLNKYLKSLADGKTYSIKDYRTFHATRIAYEELQQYVGKVLTDVERKRIIKEVSTVASDFLHNNPDMAKKSYIDPLVWELIGGV